MNFVLIRISLNSLDSISNIFVLHSFVINITSQYTDLIIFSFFFSDKVVELVVGGSFINRAYPV